MQEINSSVVFVGFEVGNEHRREMRASHPGPVEGNEKRKELAGEESVTK